MGKKQILFIGHQASRTGAPMVLLHLLRWLRANSDLEGMLLLMHGGPLKPAYARLLPTLTEHLEVPGLRKASRLLLRPVMDWRISRHAPAVCYCNTVACALGLRVPSLQSTPVITHVHELGSVIERNRESFEQLRPRTRCYIAVSEPVQRYLVEREEISGGRVDLVHEFIDAASLQHVHIPQARQRLREELHLPPEVLVLGAAGTADLRKGADLFVRVAERLQATHGAPPIALVWIGADLANDTTPQVMQIWERSGARAMMHFLGSRPDATAAIAGVDLLLLPSREDPFPLVVLEAAALGVPTICFQGAGGIPGFVAEECGRAVPYLDVEAMAGAALEALASASMRQQWGQNARQKVLASFDVNVQAPKILKILQRFV